eukprot:m.183660 g.183660  ORF g.183660 m.183660 type:complete len:588 (-) comp32165_c1_seq2:163-1926(-)
MAATDDDIAWLQEQIFDEPEEGLAADILTVAKSDQSYCKRFLEHFGCQRERTLDGVVECLQWRSNFGVSGLTLGSTESEVVLSGLFSMDSAGPNIEPIAVLRMRKFQASAPESYVTAACRAVVSILEQKVKSDLSGLAGLSLVIDLHSCQTNRINLDFIEFVRCCFYNYYPGAIDEVFVVNLSWKSKTLFALAKASFPFAVVKAVKVVGEDVDALPEHIDPKVLHWTPPPAPTPVIHVVPPYTNNTYSDTYTDTDTSQLSPSPTKPGRKVSFQLTAPGPGERPIESYTRLSPAKELIFTDNGGLKSSITIESLSSEEPVAFKIKTTSPECYRVRPNMGVIEPRSQVVVQLSRRNTNRARQAFRDKFLVMTCLLPEVLGKDEIETAAIATDAFKSFPKKRITEYRLHANYAGVVGAVGNARGPSKLHESFTATANTNTSTTTNNDNINDTNNDINDAAGGVGENTPLKQAQPPHSPSFGTPTSLHQNPTSAPSTPTTTTTISTSSEKDTSRTAAATRRRGSSNTLRQRTTGSRSSRTEPAPTTEVKVKKVNIANKIATKVIIFIVGIFVGLVMEESLKIGFLGKITGA